MLFTNTGPVDAYRGAGRPEMGYLLERLVSRAARELGADPIELRRKNMITPAQMPYKNPAGQTYDCGDFAKVLEEAMAAADWDGFAARKAAAAERGLLYGRGLACYIEITGSARVTEAVNLTVEADGTVTLVSGTQQIGQGIQTSYAQIVAELLGVPPEAVRVIQGDTDVARSGGGAGGSRSLQVGGSAALMGSRKLIEEGKALAAKELEAAAVDIEFAAGRYRIAGTDRSIGLAELAARQPGRRIAIAHSETVKGQTWPNGCQICEAEVDPDTGEVRLARLVAVDDVGRVMNPLIAEGQVHGGMMQGIGQALMEQSVYDDSGQLLTGSFMDYAMPRADALPRARHRLRRVGSQRAQCARRQGRRRGRLPRRDAGGGQRGARCARRARRRRARHAAHSGEGLARAERARLAATGLSRAQPGFEACSADAPVPAPAPGGGRAAEPIALARSMSSFACGLSVVSMWCRSQKLR